MDRDLIVWAVGAVMIFGCLFLVFGGSGNALIHYGNVGTSKIGLSVAVAGV